MATPSHLGVIAQDPHRYGRDGMRWSVPSLPYELAELQRMTDALATFQAKFPITPEERANVERYLSDG